MSNLKIRHPDFQKIRTAFLSHYSMNPQLGESRYSEWLKALSLDDSKPYGKPQERFQWAQTLIKQVKEDSDARFYKVEALFPLESMNGNLYTREELLQAARTLTGKPSNLNHNSSQKLSEIEILAAQFEDDVAECFVRILKASQIPCMIERKEIVNVSVEADWSHGAPGKGLIFEGLAWLTKDVLPGVPLTRIEPVEKIAESFTEPKPSVKERVKEQNEVSCVFCGAPADFLISICQGCFDNFQVNVPNDKTQSSPIEHIKEGELKKLVKDEIAQALKAKEQSDEDVQAQKDRSRKYGIGIKQDGNVTKPSEYSDIAEDQFGDPVNFKYPVNAAHVQAALSYFNQQDNRSGYTHEEQVKVLTKIVQAALAAGKEVQYQPNDPAYQNLPEELKSKLSGFTKESTDAEKLTTAQKELSETKEKLNNAEKTLLDTTSNLNEANKTIENLKAQLPENGLLVNPSKTMTLSEHIIVLEKLLPPIMVERSSMGMQHQAQDIRAAIWKAQEKLKGGN